MIQIGTCHIRATSCTRGIIILSYQGLNSLSDEIGLKLFLVTFSALNFCVCLFQCLLKYCSSFCLSNEVSIHAVRIKIWRHCGHNDIRIKWRSPLWNLYHYTDLFLEGSKPRFYLPNSDLDSFTISWYAVSIKKREIAFEFNLDLLFVCFSCIMKKLLTCWTQLEILTLGWVLYLFET